MPRKITTKRKCYELGFEKEVELYFEDYTPKCFVYQNTYNVLEPNLLVKVWLPKAGNNTPPMESIKVKVFVDKD